VTPADRTAVATPGILGAMIPKSKKTPRIIRVSATVCRGRRKRLRDMSLVATGCCTGDFALFRFVSATIAGMAILLLD
jgi:hypothetical protein